MWRLQPCVEAAALRGGCSPVWPGALLAVAALLVPWEIVWMCVGRLVGLLLLGPHMIWVGRWEDTQHHPNPYPGPSPNPRPSPDPNLTLTTTPT